MKHKNNDFDKKRSIELCNAVKSKYPRILVVKTGEEDNSQDVDVPFVTGLSGAICAIEAGQKTATVTKYGSVNDYVFELSEASKTVNYSDTETSVAELGEFVS